MNIAEKLRQEGFEQPEFTKDELLNAVVEKIKKNGEATFIIGKHVKTDFNSGWWMCIGTCNAYNRRFFDKWLKEEGFKIEYYTNGYGVLNAKVTL